MKHPLLNNPRLSSRLIVIFALIIIFVVVGTVFYHLVEGLSSVDAFYFTIMTLTTVGYGDIAPQTDVAKIFTAVYALLGIGVFLGFAATLFGATLNRFGVTDPVETPDRRK